MTTGEPWLVPASYAQERVWFASQLAGDAPVYHVATIVELSGPATAEPIEAALAAVVDRHETLRTSFRLVGDDLSQVVRRTVPVALEHLDFTGVSDDDLAGQVERAYTERAMRPFRLDTAPLWRATLIDAGSGRWRLIFVAHHVVFDAASGSNLQAEMAELVAAAEQGQPATLPELPIQYADYAVWQRDRLAAGRLAELLDFWGKALHDLPAVHSVPTDRPRPAQRTFAGAEVQFNVPPAIVAQVRQQARAVSGTPFMVLFAAYAALLDRLSGRPDVVVGVPTSGRDLPELQPLIGMFVNIMVLRVDCSGDPTFAELLARVRAAALAATDHQDAPYQNLVQALSGPRDPAVQPLYQLGFNYLQAGFDDTLGTAEDDLMLEIGDGPARIGYNTALFDAATVRAMADGYQTILATVLADPTIRLSQLPLAARPQPAAVPTASPAGEAEFVAPRNAAEQLVADVWVEVLDRPNIGAYDDFFDLGGHSLMALRVIARLSTATEVDIPIADFFADTTVAGVAATLERLLAAEIDKLSDEEAARMVQDGQA
jgi:hypothetical protein